MEEEENTPTTENNPPQSKDDFDPTAIEQGLAKDEAKLSLLQEEYSEIEDKLHDEFEATLESNPKALFSEEELELLASDSNIASKNKLLRDGFEKFRDGKLTSKKAEITKFEELLNGRKKEFEIASQWTKFAKDNPTVDMNAFGEFLEEDLTIRQKRELIEASKTKYDFLVGAFELYKKAKGTEDNGDDLPPDLSQVNGATGNNSFDKEEDKKEYLKSIGIGRE